MMILCYRSRSIELKSDHSVFNALKTMRYTKKIFSSTYSHFSRHVRTRINFIDTRVYTCQNVAVTGKGD